MLESTYCIYMHRNKINNKIYIGQTCQKPENRWRNGEGYKSCNQFYAAIQKYGWDNFEHLILEEGLTLEEANEKEKYYIQYYDSYRNGYNATLGGNNAQKTEEHKQKISLANIGKHPHQGELNPMYGKHFSEESKNKMRKNNYNSIRVRCIETNQIFETCHLAAKWAGLQRDGHIPEVCRGDRKMAGGYHWEFVIEGDNNE